MTALKPIEWRHVKGVPSSKYPSNLICAHPECDQAVDLRPSGEPTVHHIFPRSMIGNSSYFVEITPENGETKIIPHAIGLCGTGTTGHHGDVEEHRAWIKLEDGVFVWYDRVAKVEIHDPETGEDASIPEYWIRVGPLNPQPGYREGKPKRKRTVKGTAERTARKTVSVRLPEGVSGDDWDELLEQAGEIELQQKDTPFDPAKGGITVGKLLVTLLERWVGRI